VELKPPAYQASAEILLVNPPSPPTASQIAADPAIGKLNWSNPYLSYGNLVLVADVLIDLVDSPPVQGDVAKQGGNPKYTVALENAFDDPPVIHVSGGGSNPAEAIMSAQMVAAEVIKHLRQIQADQKVSSRYMITGTEFVRPTAATSSSSGKLRIGVEFLALGLILLLIAVSVAQSVENRR
jgi:hypothetical protein